ncbi:MAG: hypothetical protein HKL90_13825 [Elusimicrobia bacterium]|nr:hypothetical protein [Elusimicrobiota bacterium]
MRRACALLFLLARPAFSALPSVTVDVPLTPIVSAPSAAVAVGAALETPALRAVPAAALSAAPAVAAAPAAMAAEPTAAAGPASAVAPSRDTGPTAVPAAPENEAFALSLTFDGAAAPHAATTPLLERLLARVTLDDGGRPAHRAELHRAFERMLESPSMRALAERYAVDGAPATVRFEPLTDTRRDDLDGRPFFQGTRALTDWTGDSVRVRLNAAYLESHEHYREQSLPSILAHELLGHGLWYARAARENILQAFHHHELNEANARLVGWLADFELDRRFEETGAWNYLRDPQDYLDGLKLRLPFYALTFSQDELGRPVEALEARLAAARATRARLETERANQRTWMAVADHFESQHLTPAENFRALRAQFEQSDAAYTAEIAAIDDLSAQVSAVLGRFQAEQDKTSERYLRGAAEHPLFADLQREADANLQELLAHVRAAGARPEDESPEAARLRAEYWRGQIDFPELQRMYEEDRAAHPGHWR